MWVIARYIVYQQSKSPQLPGSKDVDPRLALSQGGAISEALPSIKTMAERAVRRCQRLVLGDSLKGSDFDDENDSSTDDLPVSPLFGLAALLNIIVFLSMGAVIPWALSDGPLETQTVRSRVTEACLNASRWEMFNDMFRDLFHADAILKQC